MIAVVVMCICALFGQSEESAIPMWEYLTRQEKVSFLYSMFANQVESFCDTSSMKNCNHDLMKYGLAQLKTIPEDILDSMDPYQREASDIIWETLLRGHPNARAIPKARATTTAKPNSYEDQSFDFGAQGAASARIDNVYRLLPPKGFVPQVENKRYPYAQNVVGLLKEKEGVYTRYQQQHTTTQHPYDSFEEDPLSGPMVVRVYPDGTPVEDDSPMPQDEDLMLYQLTQMRVPNL